MKKIYLHIGKHKTGSTSIQQYIDRNRSFLAENKIFVLDNSVSDLVRKRIIVPTNCTSIAHIAIRNNLQTQIRIRNLDIQRHFLKKIKDAIIMNGRLHSVIATNIIISAEAFSFMRTFHERLILRIMFKGFSVHPIFFSRNADDWLTSWRGQLKKLMIKNNINESISNTIFDFRENSWLTDDKAIVRTFGKNTRVISYEHALNEHGSVIPAFLSFLDLVPSNCPPWDGIWLNKSKVSYS